MNPCPSSDRISACCGSCKCQVTIRKDVLTLFENMRRADREVSREEALDILEKAEYGVLSTLGEDGYPYGVPVSHVVVDGKVCFHCAVEGRKLQNLRYQPKVSFVAVGQTQVMPEKFGTKFESTMVFGTAREAAPEDKQKILEALIEKYSPGFKEGGLKYITASGGRTQVWEITVEHLSGKAKR